MSVVIDLITPPSSPVMETGAPDEEEDVMEAASYESKSTITKQVAAAVANASEEEDDVVETARPPPAAGLEEAGSSSDNDDGDVTFVRRTGDNALCDFPHAREWCVRCKFKPGWEHDKCQNCFCYTEWKTHCKATHSSPYWRQLREERKAHPRASATTAASSSAAGSGSGPPAASGTASHGSQPTSAQPSKRWSNDKYFQQLEQVYPVEEPEPAGLLGSIRLRPYQKQSLAFMLEVERSTNPSLALSYSHTPRGDIWSHRAVTFTARGGWLCDEMGMGKTCVCTALILANPPAAPSPASGKVASDEIAHDKTVQAQTAQTGYDHGKLGMVSSSSDGKERRLKLTLVIANNTLVKQWETEVKKFAPGLRVHCLYNGAGSGRDAALRELYRTDVLITTPHAKWPAELTGDVRGVSIQRLIIDESHLIDGSSWKGQVNKIKGVPAVNRWCVTGTPFSGGLVDLAGQASLLGFGRDIGGARLRELYLAIHGERKKSGAVRWTPYGRSDPNERSFTNEETIDRLRDVVIRHTKSQRIHGEAALSLPDADCQTVWLDMSADEKLLYQLHACADGEPGWSQPAAMASRRSAVKLDELKQGVCMRINAACHNYSAAAIVDGGKVEECTTGVRAAAAAAFVRMHKKETSSGDDGTQEVRWKERPQQCTKYRWLVNDLTALHRSEPTFKVVIFTQYDSVQSNLVRLIRKQADAFDVSEFNSNTPPLQRHRIIDAFQNSTNRRPCVFIVTYATAAVGITLTAATRVYLMEPSIDPAQEIQAAGRIHRLGQTKEIHIKRLALRGTIDEAIAGLHDKVKTGAITIVDKQFPAEVFEHFSSHGVARPHEFAPGEQGIEKIHEIQTASREWGSGHRDGRPASTFGGFPPGAKGPDRCGYLFRAAPCVCCGRIQKLDGKLEWWGTGNMSWLNGLKGCPRTITTDTPKRPTSTAEAAALVGNQDPPPAEVHQLMMRVAKLTLQAVKTALHEKEATVEKLQRKSSASSATSAWSGDEDAQNRWRLQRAQTEVTEAKEKLEVATREYQKAVNPTVVGDSLPPPAPKPLSQPMPAFRPPSMPVISSKRPRFSSLDQSSESSDDDDPLCRLTSSLKRPRVASSNAGSSSSLPAATGARQQSPSAPRMHGLGE